MLILPSLLLEKIPVEDLLKNEEVLDILFQRYTVLHGYSVNIVELKSSTKADKKPLELFSGLEESLKRQKNYLNADKDSIPTSIPYSKRREIPEETLINASHYGGWRYIIGFMSGQQKGYNLERGGHGIQVFSYYTGMNDYATVATKAQFDSPAALTFKIQAQYLEAAHNKYEAGLKPEHRDKISDIELKNLKTGQIIKATNLNEFLEILKT